mgnify:CR=1 FL=1
MLLNLQIVPTNRCETFSWLFFILYFKYSLEKYQIIFFGKFWTHIVWNNQMGSNWKKNWSTTRNSILISISKLNIIPQYHYYHNHHELLLRQFDENFFLLNNQIKKQKNRMSSCKLQHVFRLSLPVPLQP